MKTSATQFEIIVNFMEEHGDLNKPSSTRNAHGRIQAIQLWERLTRCLNADGSGTVKPTEKWKKVWSDLKNNTKKKAAKINRAACGTGGGPALQIKLSDLEQRILSIIGHQAVTGLANIAEAGFTEINPGQDTNRTMTLEESPSIMNFIDFHTQTESFNVVQEPEEPFEVVYVQNESQSSPPRPQQPSPSLNFQHFSSRPQTPRALPVNLQHLSPRPQTSQAPPVNFQHLSARLQTPPAPPDSFRLRNDAIPAHSGQTPRHGRGMVSHRIVSPRRRHRRQTNVEQAAQHFLDNDESWRAFLIKQHEDELEIKKQKLEVEKSWQNIAEKAIAALNTYFNSRNSC